MRLGTHKVTHTYHHYSRKGGFESSPPSTCDCRKAFPRRSSSPFITTYHTPISFVNNKIPQTVVYYYLPPNPTPHSAGLRPSSPENISPHAKHQYPPKDRPCSINIAHNNSSHSQSQFTGSTNDGRPNRSGCCWYVISEIFDALADFSGHKGVALIVLCFVDCQGQVPASQGSHVRARQKPAVVCRFYGTKNGG